MTDDQKRVRTLIEEAMADGLTYTQTLTFLTPQEFAIEQSRTESEIARIEAECDELRTEVLAELREELETTQIDPLASWDHTGATRN